MYSYVRAFIAVIAAVWAMGAISACDNPVEDDHDHEPVEAAGVILLSGGDELLRVENAQASGTLVVPAGEETGEIEVEFLDEDGNLIHTDDFGDEYSLRWVVEDEDIVALEEAGRWSFTAHGVSAGETMVELQLFHLNHDDLKAPFPVRVE